MTYIVVVAAVWYIGYCMGRVDEREHPTKRSARPAKPTKPPRWGTLPPPMLPPDKQL